MNAAVVVAKGVQRRPMTMQGKSSSGGSSNGGGGGGRRKHRRVFVAHRCRVFLGGGEGYRRRPQGPRRSGWKSRVHSVGTLLVLLQNSTATATGTGTGIWYLVAVLGCIG